MIKFVLCDDNIQVLSKLKETGKIERVGSDRKGSWKIL